MKYILLLFLVFFSSFVRADSVPANALVSEFFTHVQKMTLRFDQTKTIPDIEKSFQSSGVFQFERNKGVIVKQEKPFAQTFISTTEKFCFADRTDELKNLPYFSNVKFLVDHLLAGNLADLERIFEITYYEKNNIWHMEMVPVRKDMKSFVQKIILTGSISTIKKLVIEYTDGTKMDVNFYPIQQDLTDEIKC